MQVNKDKEDHILVKQIRDGNRKAFESLFIKYYSPLCAYANQFVGMEQREEIVQNFMVWLWENRTCVYIKSSLRNYLFTAIKYKCLTYLHKQAIRIRVDNLIYNTNKEFYEDPDFYIVNELKEAIETAINNLPENYKEAFVMNRCQRLSYSEIAIHLNVSPKTIEYRIQQALKILRINLKEYLPIIIL